MAIADSILLDPLSESATNVQLELNDGVGYTLLEHDYPDPELDAIYASSADTEGDIPISVRPKNRVIPVKLRVAGTTALDLDQKLGVLAQKVGKFNREGGTVKRTTPSLLAITFDVLPESGMPGVTFNKRYVNRLKSEVDLRFVCAPYGRAAEISTILDDFASDSIGAGKYTFDAAGGTLSVAGGLLVPSSTAEKRLYRSAEGLTYPDAQLTVKVTTGASVASGLTGLIQRRLAATDYLRAQVNFAGAASTLSIDKVAAGTPSTLATSGAFTTAAATSYWLRFRTEANKLTAELWTAAPTPTGSPAQSLTFTLTGGDITTFGAGIAGNVGLRLVPQATDYRWDDFQIDPNAFGPGTGDRSIVVYAIKGDAPALARAVVDEGSSKDQWHGHWGVRSRYYDAAATAALGFEAEACTPLGGATVVTLAGSSGGGSNNAVEQGTLTLDWQALLSFQASGAGAYKSHVGLYEVIARLHRPTTNTGSVSTALEWAEGDFTKVTRNDAVTYTVDEREGDFTIARLGQVDLTKAKRGTQRWDGRIIAKSTVLGDKLRVDRVWLRPVSESAGEVTVAPLLQTPSSFSARDEFDQTAGALGGKTAPVGGVWAAVGTLGGSDLTVNATSHWVTRTADSDASNKGRGMTIPVTLTDTLVQIDTAIGSEASFGFTFHQLISRYVDDSNYQATVLSVNDNGVANLVTLVYIAGVQTNLVNKLSAITLSPNAFVTLRTVVDAQGRVFVWLGPKGAPQLVLAGSHTSLATGGALASGKPGFRDAFQGGAPAKTRYYDNFMAAVPTVDAVVYSGREAEIRNDGFLRQDAAAAVWGEKTVDGDYLQLPPAGREARPAELLLRFCRNTPDIGFDPGLDSTSGAVFYTPRYRSIPAP